MTDLRKMQLAIKQAGELASNLRELNARLESVFKPHGNDFRYGMAIAFEIMEALLWDATQGGESTSYDLFKAELDSDLARLRVETDIDTD